MNTEIIASHSQSSTLLLQTQRSEAYFTPEVIEQGRTQHKSWRSGACMENTETLSMLGLYTAPAFIFTRRKMKSHITDIIINIARQMSSFGGITANKIGGIRGNIDALAKGWRAGNNESIEITAKTGTTKTTTNKMERMQNTGHQQQEKQIQHFAPALLFSAITNHILWEAKQ